MRESYPQVSKLSFQILLTFATTYLCKSGFSAFVHIKNESTKSKESKNDIRLALLSSKPRIPKLALWLHTAQSNVALTDVKLINYLKLNIFEVFLL